MDQIDKKDVIRILEEIAVLLELKGESPFKKELFDELQLSLNVQISNTLTGGSYA